MRQAAKRLGSNARERQLTRVLKLAQCAQTSGVTRAGRMKGGRRRRRGGGGGGGGRIRLRKDRRASWPSIVAAAAWHHALTIKRNKHITISAMTLLVCRAAAANGKRRGKHNVINHGCASHLQLSHQHASLMSIYLSVTTPIFRI